MAMHAQLPVKAIRDDSGVAYVPITDGRSIGYLVTKPGSRPMAVYFEPVTDLSVGRPDEPAIAVLTGLAGEDATAVCCVNVNCNDR